MLACSQRHYDLVKVLVEKGAKVNHVDKVRLRQQACCTVNLIEPNVWNTVQSDRPQQGRGQWQSRDRAASDQQWSRGCEG